ATCGVEFYPALCGTAFKNKGVQLLLNAVVDYLPSPLDVKPIVGHTVDNEEEEYIARPDDSEPFAALAFTGLAEPFVGKLTFCCLYSRARDGGCCVQSSATGTRERVRRSLRTPAKRRQVISTVCSGDIAAAVGLKATGTGGTRT